MLFHQPLFSLKVGLGVAYQAIQDSPECLLAFAADNPLVQAETPHRSGSLPLINLC